MLLPSVMLHTCLKFSPMAHTCVQSAISHIFMNSFCFTLQFHCFTLQLPDLETPHLVFQPVYLMSACSQKEHVYYSCWCWIWIIKHKWKEIPCSDTFKQNNQLCFYPLDFTAFKLTSWFSLLTLILSSSFHTVLTKLENSRTQRYLTVSWWCQKARESDHFTFKWIINELNEEKCDNTWIGK